MIKFIMILITVFFLQYNIVSAGSKSCAVIPFSDITLYAKDLKTNELYSDLILERIISDNLFLVKEAHVIEDEKIRCLTDGSYANAKKMQNVMSADNFDSIFGSDSFNDREASDIKYATVGQYVSPDIVKEIGRLYQVDYLLHGTIYYIGTEEDKHNSANELINAAGRTLNFFTGIDIGNINISSKGIIAECDLRLIEVNSGKVVWYNKNEFLSDKYNIIVEDVIVGDNHYTSDMYYNAVNGAVGVNIGELAKYVRDNC